MLECFFSNPKRASSMPSSKSLTLDDSDPVYSAISSGRLSPAFPGRSKSIMDSSAILIGVAGAAKAIPTYSQEPYLDFRRSMEEMVAVLSAGSRLDFAVLRDLLLCYLVLNPRDAHQCIVTAFTDLLLSLQASRTSFFD